MKAFAIKTLLTSCAVGALLISSPAINEAQAQNKFFENLKRDSREAIDNARKDKVLGRVVQGAGAALIIYGLADGKAAPAILGTLLVGAPEVFQRDLSTQYGREWGWSGCTKCRDPKVVVVPGRNHSEAERAAVSEAVKRDVMDVQGALAALGFYKISIDGDYGPGTRKAVNLFQASISERQTGKLTPSQRAELFDQAQAMGWQSSKPALTQEANAAPVMVPTIKEYKLANSQTEQFFETYLSGELTSVKEVELRPDGLMQITLLDEAVAAGSPKQIIAGAEKISIKPHPISDQWMTVDVFDVASDADMTLNVKDTFASVEEAEAWRAESLSKVEILQKLTERDNPAATVEVAEANLQPVNVTGTEQAVANGSCSETVYLALNFPEGNGNISHYNIIPPAQTIMMDNGDSTAYFVGNCIGGEYDFSYVYIEKGQSQSDWKHHKREGKFEIAATSSQCEIDLNTPDGSASLECF